VIDRFSEDIDLALDRSLYGQAPLHGAEDASIFGLQYEEQ
jgi:hypothetical protein